LNDKPVELNEKSVNKCKDSLDSFDKDLIRRVVVGFFLKLIPFFQQKLSQAFSLLIYNIHKLYIT
jgi:hypothetical protein